MKIGIDLDNTIVCYDKVFTLLAQQMGIYLSNASSPKCELRDILRAKPNGESLWTRLQGSAYGPKMKYAEPYPGSCSAITALIDSGHQVVIISHKTHYPAIGPAYDLHGFASEWIQYHLGHLSLSFYFETTRWEKLVRIQSAGCQVFIDDLHSLLADPAFPTDVERVWFFPAPGAEGNHFTAGISTLHSWKNLVPWLSKRPAFPPEENPPLYETRRNGPWSGDAAGLLTESVNRMLNQRITACQNLEGGINNQVFRLQTIQGQLFIGKIYRRSPRDPRDRLMHETRFLNLLEKAGVQGVPRVLAIDEDRGIVILTHLPGHPWPEDIAAPTWIWQQFSNFLSRIQGAALLPEAKNIPLSAEAAFSLQEHLGWVQQRRDRWRRLALDGEFTSDINRIVLEVLEPEYDDVATRTINHPEFRKHLNPKTLILTPSDFGLHNALVSSKGTVYFLDFEYAGWDDPIKTVFDFSLQPRHSAGRPNSLEFLYPHIHIDTMDSHAQLLGELLALKWRYIVLTAKVSPSVRTIINLPRSMVAEYIDTTDPIG